MALDPVGSEQNASPRPIEESRIVYLLDQPAHATVREMLVGSEDEWSEGDQSGEDEW